MKFSMGGFGATAFSGKLGGHVANKNGVIRIKAIPANPRSSTQLLQRARLTLLTQAWAGLSETQRLTWEAAASSGDWKITDSLGKQQNPSGEGLYIELNLNLLTIGAATIDEAPAKEAAPQITLGAVTLNTTPVFTVAYTGTLGSGHTLVATCSAQVSPGRMKRPQSAMRFVAISTASSPITLTTAYPALFGTIVLGQKIYGQVEIINETTGQRAIVGGFSAIVAAP